MDTVRASGSVTRALEHRVLSLRLAYWGMLVDRLKPSRSYPSFDQMRRPVELHVTKVE